MRDSNYDLIKFQATEEGLAVVTINRPDVHNAFNMELIAELTDAFAFENHGVLRLVDVESESQPMYVLDASSAWIEYTLQKMSELVMHVVRKVSTSPHVLPASYCVLTMWASAAVLVWLSPQK